MVIIKFCPKCGEELIKVYEEKGSYSKTPVFYDQETGEEIWHEKWACPNVSFWAINHAEVFYNFKKLKL